VSKLSRLAILAADETIAYVERSSQDYTRKPFVAILHSLDEYTMRLSQAQAGRAKTDTFTVLYSGALNKIKGADRLIAMIEQARDKYRWVICASGEFEHDVRRLSAANSNVEFLGLISHKEVIRLQAEADVLIALRSADSAEYRYYSECAATGTLIEYLLRYPGDCGLLRVLLRGRGKRGERSEAGGLRGVVAPRFRTSGTPVVSPDIGAISSQVRPYLNFLTSQRPDDIIGLIDEIRANYSTYVSKAARGCQYVVEHANSRFQDQLDIEFLERVCRDKFGYWTMVDETLLCPRPEISRRAERLLGAARCHD